MYKIGQEKVCSKRGSLSSACSSWKTAGSTEDNTHIFNEWMIFLFERDINLHLLYLINLMHFLFFYFINWMFYAFLTHNTAGLPLDRNWKSQSSRNERAALQQNDMRTNIKAKEWVSL